jgi:hypothetical protein
MSSIISVMAPLLGLFKLSHDRGHAETSTLVSKLHHKWMVGFLFANCVIISSTSLIYGPMLCATTDSISEATLNAHCWAQARTPKSKDISQQNPNSQLPRNPSF